MLTRRRALLAVSLVLVAIAAWTVWLVSARLKTFARSRSKRQSVSEPLWWHRTESHGSAAIGDLQAAAASARSHTDGLWWGAITKSPYIGDDAAGVRALSASIDVLASGALAPLGNALDAADSITDEGRIDVDVVEEIGKNVTAASAAFSSAADLVQDQVSSDFIGALQTRYNDYTGTISELADDLSSAETAFDVLPSMLGADEPRQISIDL